MRQKVKTKLLVWVVILVMLFTYAAPAQVLALESSLQTETSPIQDSNTAAVLSEQETEAELIASGALSAETDISPINGVVEGSPTVTPVKPDISYGPYGKDDAKVHAYEPFKQLKQEQADKAAETTQKATFSKDMVLIKLETPLYPSTSTKTLNASMDDEILFQELGVTALNPVFTAQTSRKSPFYQGDEASQNLAKWYKASLKEGTDVSSTVENLKKQANVVTAEPNYLRTALETPIEGSGGGGDGLAQDPSISEQWYLDKLGIRQAWDELKQNNINSGGSRDVVVAVIDSGVDYNHPDLSGNMWVNTGEIPGNGIDDDQNGYVDDVYGANVVGNQYYGQSGNPMDDNGHGTHVAGIIAAQANNGIGGSGIANNVQIMAIKAAQSSGTLTAADIAQGINYAAEKGADVINMSFGGYGRSQVEEDALAQAFSTSVLVASAGNDGLPNVPFPILGKNVFPAAYPWVLGVMAEGLQPAANGDNLASFSNWDYIAQDSHEYEVMAPGVEIYSTLPDGKYAKWSGTSMAAPIVSGIAALLRSKFTDKESYSSRFIMGQLASTGELKQGITYDDKEDPIFYHEVNAFKALTDTPQPKLSYLEHYIFDKSEIAPGNNGDGVVDAGETVDLAMIIRNHWGKADNVQVKLDTLAGAGMSDPYVSLLIDSVDYGAVGTFNTDDNGLIYTDDVVTGVNHPFKIKVAENTPNDHVIPVNVTITARNGMNPSDTNVYTSQDSFNLVVRNGSVLPNVISSDMTLTKDKYWIIPNATTIQAGATVRVEPGTQIQFWSSQPEDPYSEEKAMAYLSVKGQFLVNGTAAEPVEMFASGLYPGYEVKVYSTSSLDYYGSVGGYQGNAEINYARVLNPNVAVQKIDHAYFSQDLFDIMYKRYLANGKVNTEYYYGPVVYGKVDNSIFYKLGYKLWDTHVYGMLRLNGPNKGNLFDSCVYYMDEQASQDNVYLKNYKLPETQYGNRTYWTSQGQGFGTMIDPKQALLSTNPKKFNDNGSSYFLVNPQLPYTGYDYEFDLFSLVENYAQSFGGHIVTINDAAENEFLRANYAGERIGLSDYSQKGNFQWISKEITAYTNWAEGTPSSTSTGFMRIGNDGKWYDMNAYGYGFGYGGTGGYVIEVPGTSRVTGITLDQSSLTLGVGGSSFTLQPTITPTNANNQSLEWTSSNPSVASVDESGTVKPLTKGSTTITATTADGGFTASCEIQAVDIILPTGLTLNKASTTLTAGQAEKLEATVLPTNTTSKAVEWSSSDTKVATVNEVGMVQAISNGTAVITVMTEDGGFTAQCEVRVVVPVSGVTLDQSFLRLVAGDAPTQLQATVQPLDATDKGVTWSSSNDKVVRVDSTGAVTPIGVGTALVIATSVANGDTATCTVTVWDKTVNFAATQVAAGINHVIALNNDGTVWAWGNNMYGQLGDGSQTDRTTPVQVSNLSEVIKVAAGNAQSLALRSDGTVWSWGINSSLPTQVSDLTDVVDVAVGSNHSIAVKSDGTVWTWGINDYGQLGDGSTTYRSLPVQVQNLTDAIAISAGSQHTVALKRDGTVWTWGYNGYGQLGDGTTVDRKLPVKVQGLTDVLSINAGYSCTMASKNTGTVWNWGYFYTYSGSTPQSVTGLTDVKEIAAGDSHGMILKNDGTIWAWGYNQDGQLGDGTTTTQSTPVQVKDLTNVKSIAAGPNYSSGIKSDGTLWAWGNNQSGQLGNLTTIGSLTPTQTLFGIIQDSIPPQILTTTPENNATGVSTSTPLLIQFDEAVRQGDDFSLITLRDSNNKSISFKSKTISGNTLTLVPITELTANVSYTLTIPDRALSDVFNNPGAASSLAFTTGAGTVQVLSTIQLIHSQPLKIANVVTEASEVQADLTQAILDQKRQEFIDKGGLSTIRNNAILNRWWDPDLKTWMRFTSNEGDAYKQYLAKNYWGTTSELLINKALIDFNDYQSMSEIVYKPILTEAPETAYPFMTDLYVSTDNEARTSKVGAEKITVHVSFNRDMDQTIQPQVTFGPDMPTTDYTINALNGGWTDARHWSGQTNITPLTGDGYQLFRVAGAVAADDPWLITGDDSERFRFEIITSGTEAMNLQAWGEEGKIGLSWTQNDFDILAGYNLYRSNSPTETFTKINTSIIPPDQKSYEDVNVEPGKTYYYKFTVLKTDLSTDPTAESKFSNVAAASATDTVSPVITHDPLKAAAVGLGLQIYADVTDNVLVKGVALYYRKTGTTDYTRKEMSRSTNNRYTTTLEGSLVQAPGIEYYLEATDGISTVRNGSPNAPNKVLVTDAPKITAASPNVGPETGGTSVIITGTNFKEGATVTFDQAVASGVVVESTNRITAISPAHFPASVDITVTNPEGYKDTLLHAFTYKSEGADISLPQISANNGGSFEVPVEINNVSGLRSAAFKVNFDQDILTVKNVRLGNLTSNFVLAQNSNIPGELSIQMASATAVAGSGNLVYLEFEVLSTDKTSTALTLNDIQLNDGAIAVSKTDGLFTISATHALRGTVTYYSDYSPVKNVDLSLQGDKTYASSSGESGIYALNGIESGSYTLRAAKETDLVGITAYDASLILQNAAGLISLTSQQRLAADVDKNGEVNAMDASYVLEKAAELLQLPFPGAGQTWAFEPSTRDYPNIVSDLSEQNFSAILLGDVSGNWGKVSSDNPSVQSIGSTTLTLTTGTKVGNEYQTQLLVDNLDRPVYGCDLIIQYDPLKLRPKTINKTNLTGTFALVYNPNTPGLIHIALAGAVPVNQNGALLDLNFESLGTEGGLQPQVLSAQINEESVVVKSDQSDSLRTTGVLRIGVNDDNRAGVFIGLQDLVDSQGVSVANKKVQHYKIGLAYTPGQVSISEITDQANLGLNPPAIDGSGVVVATNGQNLETSAYDSLIFVPLALIGSAKEQTNVTITFQDVTDQNGNPINVPDPLTLTLQRGKILNESGKSEPGIGDAVAGLQHLAGLRQAGLAEGEINVINMASIKQFSIDQKLAPSVKVIIALMQYLVDLRDDFFQPTEH